MQNTKINLDTSNGPPITQKFSEVVEHPKIAP